MIKPYRGSGDSGFTTLANGKRVEKWSDLVALYGELDELNVGLGFAAEALQSCRGDESLLRACYRIQEELFQLAIPLALKQRKSANLERSILMLTQETDQMNEALPILQSFVLPGGCEEAARLHLARVVCRRAERSAFKVAEKDANLQTIGIYLNRLSDWLFAAARTTVMLGNIEEIPVRTNF